MKEYLLGEFIIMMSFMIGFVIVLSSITNASQILFILGILMMTTPIVIVLDKVYKK